MARVVLHPDQRVVPQPRTSANTRDLFCQVTEAMTEDNGLLIFDPTDPNARDVRTPFGRQNPPRLVTQAQRAPPRAPLPPPTPALEPHIPVRGSRTIERILLQDELQKLEDRHPSLRRENARLRQNLIAVMRMNEVMSRAMRMEIAAYDHA